MSLSRAEFMIEEQEARMSEIKAGRPPQYASDRVNLSIRIDPELKARLEEAASERDVSVTWLMTRAVEDFLPRLIPVEEIRWTREADK